MLWFFGIFFMNNIVGIWTSISEMVIPYPWVLPFDKNMYHGHFMKLYCVRHILDTCVRYICSYVVQNFLSVDITLSMWCRITASVAWNFYIIYPFFFFSLSLNSVPLYSIFVSIHEKVRKMYPWHQKIPMKGFSWKVG